MFDEENLVESANNDGSFAGAVVEVVLGEDVRGDVVAHSIGNSEEKRLNYNDSDRNICYCCAKV